MISDEQLQHWNRLGLIPGPLENDDHFIRRATKSLTQAASPSKIAIEALDKVAHLFDIRPEWVPVFFSKKSLHPWMPACTWLDEEIPRIQLHPRLETHHYMLFSNTRRFEILGHELVHAARIGFDEGLLEELLAYELTHPTLGRLRYANVISPKMFNATWEAPTLIGLFSLNLACISLYSSLIGFWPLVGFLLFLYGRYLWCENRYITAFRSLETGLGSRQKALAVLVRLTFHEMKWVGKTEWSRLRSDIEQKGKTSLRWRQIHLAYF